MKRLLLTFLALSAASIAWDTTQVSGGETPNQPTAEEVAANRPTATPPATERPAQVISGVACLADPTALEDLRKRRDELESKQKELQTKEQDLALREKALNEELKKLQEIRDDIAKIDGARKKEGDEKVAKLVETLETMSPKPASALVAALDETLAVAAMSRISTLKLAKILNIMEPAKSSRLSELLAGVVRARAQSLASSDATATTNSNGRR